MKWRCWPVRRPILKPRHVAHATPLAAGAHAKKMIIWKTIVCAAVATPFLALPPLVWHQTPPSFYLPPNHTATGPVTPWGGWNGHDDDHHGHHGKSPENIPEPATAALLGAALVAVGLISRKRVSKREQ